MGKAITKIVNDDSRIFALANDGTMWTTDCVSPLVWTQLPDIRAQTGQTPVDIGVANRIPPQSGLTRFVVCGNGALYHLDWSNAGVGTWTLDQGLP
jgi:hypothetical protein